MTQYWRTYTCNSIENRKHLQNTEININEIFLRIFTVYKYIYKMILTNILFKKKKNWSKIL